MRKERLFIRFIKEIKISYICYAIALIVFLIGVNNISSSTVIKQEESLNTALQRDTIHCYAIEGFYPPSLDYIKQHYGLVYNEDLFFVDYQPIGSNIMPSITIIRKEN